eukprot:TRINITY_DN2977_c0_g1_i1.p1 TRINITY_DN2977_c0_g1~~TRINITY_DN2977_c0_g1_i1.p1  ORF type:complete len:256 (-),score=34.08 TRINITY_DN2977_c0_g1_i1:214-981(-)
MNRQSLRMSGSYATGERSIVGDDENEDWATIHIKTIDSIFSMSLALSSTVGRLREMIINQKNLQNKNVRLLYQGKILLDNTTLLSAGLKDGCYVHCAISDFVPLEERQAVPEAPVLRGLDRLRESGFSEAEIEQFRLQFRASRAHAYGSQLPASGSSDQNLLMIEEQWMEETINASTLARDQAEGNFNAYEDSYGSASEGTYKDLLIGMVMGFLLGLITLFWLYDTALPRKTKYGILAGIGCNISFGIIRISQTP